MDFYNSVRTSALFPTHGFICLLALNERDKRETDKNRQSQLDNPACCWV